jgi:signal transduction histidine kinase
MFQDITRRQEIEALYEKLRALDKAKEDLTHMIVHDLRTPLTSILVGMQTLPVLGGLSAEHLEVAEISVRGGEALLGMINDLLDISKLEAGSLKLEYDAVAPGKLVGRALAQVAPLAKHAEIALSAQVARQLPMMICDEDKLLRTLVNLLANAVKFTAAGGSVDLAVGLGNSADELLFAVRDTGEGIPEEAFAHIFEQRRAHHVDRPGPHVQQDGRRGTRRPHLGREHRGSGQHVLLYGAAGRNRRQGTGDLVRLYLRVPRLAAREFW